MSASIPDPAVLAPTPPSDDPNRLLTAHEIAVRLAVPESWVREHTRTGRLPHLPLGRYRRYRWESVLRWLAEQEAGGAAWRKHHPRHLS